MTAKRGRAIRQACPACQIRGRGRQARSPMIRPFDAALPICPSRLIFKAIPDPIFRQTRHAGQTPAGVGSARRNTRKTLTELCCIAI